MSSHAIQWPKGQSRYMVLAEQLAGQIQNGQYKPGEFLPAEAHLCDTYGVSRFTARQAIQELKKRGFIATHHGIGSEVISPKPLDGEFVFSFDSVDEFLAATENLTTQVASATKKAADVDIADVLGLEVGASYFSVEGSLITKKGRDLIAIVRLHVPIKYSGIKSLLGRGRNSVSRLIEAKYHVRTAQIHQTIEPVRLNRIQAESFGLPQRCAGLLVCRTYVDAAKNVFLYARNVHAGKSARLSFEIRRKSE